ncbi:right-handed parallel beta-helix repeat-containing protein [Dokdonella sp.]|uniref:right-handed parallel beta-helix repeat-containing protein n=1 Tax=Dokdonella sp. TaxID=2291710 RepID=UPI00263659A9|nr:right-handed parallel beta-helix repeat-containing protein [Dokdonella sp.]
MSFFRTLARLVLGGAFLVHSAFAADYEVTQAGDSGSNTLRAAIAAANDHPGVDRVLIRVAGPILLNSGIPVTDPVEIVGTHPAAASEIVQAAAERIFDLLGDRNAPRAMSVSLRRLHLRNGRADAGDGGAIHASAVRLRVESCRFSGNEATHDGGAIYTDDVDATILDSVFEGNDAGDSGGAVMVSASDLVVERSRFTGNHADVGGGLAGGGTTSRLDIKDSLIQDNTALHGGGGVRFSAERLRVYRSAVVGNTAEFSDGGGIWLAGPVDGDASVVENSTITANAAPSESAGGSGIYVADGKLALRNSTVVANATGPAGDTFTSGGGVFVGGSESRLDVGSTIIAGNTQGPSATPRDLVRDLDPLVTPPSIVSVRRSLVQAMPDVGAVNGVDAENLWQADPMLEPLRDNGGPTPTMALKLGSPACERGENAASLATDQRGAGFSRGYGAVDIGAYEYRGDTIFYGDFELHDPQEFGCARRP